MKKVLFTLAILTNLMVANAQIGITVGGNMTKYKYTSDREAILSFNAGLVYKTQIANRFYVQPELVYTIKGAAVYPPTPIGNTNTMIKFNNHMNYVELSLPFFYSAELSDSFTLEIGAGGYAAYLVNAKNIAKNYDGTTTKKDFAIGSTMTDDFKALDFGANIVTGFTLGNKIGFHIKYDLGLANLSPQPNYPALKTRNLSFNITYYFGER